MSDDQVTTPMGGETISPMGNADQQISPELLNKPVRPDELQSSSDPAVAQQLGLVKQKNSELLGKNKQLINDLKSLRDDFETMKAAQQNTARENLENQGAFKELYESEKARAKTLEQRLISETTELKAQLSQVEESAKQERLRAVATSQLSQANAVNSEQLYKLLSPQLRTDDEGKPVILDGGVEQPLGDYLANLKQAPGWQHHFGASGAQGMGTSTARSVAPGMENPYRTGNLTEAMALEVTNPELAKALKAEASRV
jgi:hypothetical protein